MTYSRKLSGVFIAAAGVIALSISTSSFAQTNNMAAKGPASKNQVAFNTASVKPYVDEINGLLTALIAVKTPQQAAAVATQLNQELPKIEAQHKHLSAAIESLGADIAANKVTPEMTQAIDVLSATEAKAGPAIEVEMARIIKFYPKIGALFQKYLATYNE